MTIWGWIAIVFAVLGIGVFLGELIANAIGKILDSFWNGFK
jgi:hypothetical protein